MFTSGRWLLFQLDKRVAKLVCLNGPVCKSPSVHPFARLWVCIEDSGPTYTMIRTNGRPTKGPVDETSDQQTSRPIGRASEQKGQTQVDVLLLGSALVHFRSPGPSRVLHN